MFRVPEECPQGVADIITECMRENPDRRPTSKDVFQALRSEGAGRNGIRVPSTPYARTAPVSLPDPVVPVTKPNAITHITTRGYSTDDPDNVYIYPGEHAAKPGPAIPASGITLPSTTGGDYGSSPGGTDEEDNAFVSSEAPAAMLLKVGSLPSCDPSDGGDVYLNPNASFHRMHSVQPAKSKNSPGAADSGGALLTRPLASLPVTRRSVHGRGDAHGAGRQVFSMHTPPPRTT